MDANRLFRPCVADQAVDGVGSITLLRGFDAFNHQIAVVAAHIGRHGMGDHHLITGKGWMGRSKEQREGGTFPDRNQIQRHQFFLFGDNFCGCIHQVNPYAYLFNRRATIILHFPQDPQVANRGIAQVNILDLQW